MVIDEECFYVPLMAGPLNKCRAHSLARYYFTLGEPFAERIQLFSGNVGLCERQFA